MSLTAQCDVVIRQEHNEWRVVKDLLLGHFTKLVGS